MGISCPFLWSWNEQADSITHSLLIPCQCSLMEEPILTECMTHWYPKAVFVSNTSKHIELFRAQKRYQCLVHLHIHTWVCRYKHPATPLWAHTHTEIWLNAPPPSPCFNKTSGPSASHKTSPAASLGQNNLIWNLLNCNGFIETNPVTVNLLISSCSLLILFVSFTTALERTCGDSEYLSVDKHSIFNFFFWKVWNPSLP